MRKINTLVAGALCAVALLGAGCAGGASVDQSSPEKVVSTFMNALEHQDKATAKAVVDPDSEMSKDFDDGWNDVKKIPLQSFTIKGSDENSVAVELNLKVDNGTKTTTTHVEVTQKDGKWYVTNMD